MRQYTAPASSPVRYDPVMINSQQQPPSDNPTSLKEYETQVLAMAVPLADEGDDLQLDFSAKNHAFSLDNVSYITHKENGQFDVECPKPNESTFNTCLSLFLHSLVHPKQVSTVLQIPTQRPLLLARCSATITTTRRTTTISTLTTARTRLTGRSR